MPTHDLVSDFGGVGDGQRVSVTASITSGASPVLTPATPIFLAGDVGKIIYLKASGFSYTTSSTPITITAYNAGTGAVTLSGTNSTSQSSVTMDILWGTDNTNAFVGASGSYRAWAQSNGSAQSNLTIPAGHYLANLDPFRPLNKGVKNALITGSGAGSCKLSNVNPSEMRIGGDVPITQNLGLTNASGFTARLNSTTAGSSTATLVDKAGYGSRITVGADCFVTGYDMQSVGAGTFGYPPNPHFYEANKITAYDSGTGTITFQNPLKYSYMSDWPVWSIGINVTDQGGPATIYVLTDYDRVVEIQSLTLDSPYDQIACHGRSVILRNVVCTGFGVYPTQNQTFAAYNCTVPFSYELDKIVGTVLFDHCDLGILQIQSASPDVLTMIGGTCRHLTGTPKSLIIDGVDLTGSSVGNDKQIQVGCGFGYTSSVSLSNVTNLDFLNDGYSVNTGIHGGGFSATLPMTSGIFTFLKSQNDGVGGFQNPGANLVPGSRISLDNKMFINIVRVWEDGTFVYHQTNLTGGWPFTVAQANEYPCLDFTMVSCSGSERHIEDYNQAAAHIPLWSYSKRTYVGGPTSGTALPTNSSPKLYGRPTAIKLTVTSLFTGASALGFKQNQNTNGRYYKESDYATLLSNFGSTINMKTGLGVTRIMANAIAGSNAQSGDTLFSFLSLGSVWFHARPNSEPAFTANVTNGDTPTVVVEWIMDQGIIDAVVTSTPYVPRTSKIISHFQSSDWIFVR